MKYAILTFGCRTNQADSFDLEHDLRKRGGEQAAIESADLVVVNTCSVTATAEQSARQAIRRVARVNPHARIVAAGCYATRAGADVAALPVWRVVSNEEKRTAWQDAARDFSSGAAKQLATGVAPAADVSVAGTWPTMPGPGSRGRTIYLLRVQTGCDQWCTYCIVPATRGRPRSVPLDDVMRQVSEAATAGFTQAMVTGVHLGGYGRDLDARRSLADLVLALSVHPADMRFALSAVEPMDFGDEVLDALAGSDRFARHFHLPLQHASDRILAAMARPYTIDRYAAIVSRLSDRFPDASIGADLIVGFPGEAEVDFEACVRYLEASPLASVHVFPFSPRPGTAAARLPGRPRGEEVRRRVGELRAIGAALDRRFRQRFVGSVRRGLTIEDGSLVLTDNYLRVRIPRGRRRNEQVEVRILEDGEPMTGEIAQS